MTVYGALSMVIHSLLSAQASVLAAHPSELSPWQTGAKVDLPTALISTCAVPMHALTLRTCYMYIAHRRPSISSGLYAIAPGLVVWITPQAH